jgi:hypothetical protein
MTPVSVPLEPLMVWRSAEETSTVERSVNSGFQETQGKSNHVVARVDPYLQPPLERANHLPN